MIIDELRKKIHNLFQQITNTRKKMKIKTNLRHLIHVEKVNYKRIIYSFA